MSWGRRQAGGQGGKLCQGEWVKVSRSPLASVLQHSPSQPPPPTTWPTGRISLLNPAPTSYLPIFVFGYISHSLILAGNPNIPISSDTNSVQTSKMSTIHPIKSSYSKSEWSPSAQFGNRARIGFSRKELSDRKGNKQENVYRDHPEV